MRKGFAQSIARLFSFRPPLAWFALLYAVATTVFCLTRYLSGSPGMDPSDAVKRITASIAFYGSIALALLIFQVTSRRSFRILIALRIAVFLGIAFSLDQPLGAQLAFFTGILFELAIYERFPLNLVVCLASILCYLLGQYLRTTGGLVLSRAALLETVGKDLNVAAFSSLVSVMACMMIYYRERIIQQAEEIRRLDLAVAKLSEANLSYQQYASRAEQLSMIEERKRITREIHDVIGYTMTNVIMMMEAVTDMMRRDPGKVQELVNTARQNAEEGLDEIRHALHLLRAQEQPPGTSLEAIVKLARVYQFATGVQVVLELGNLPSTLEGPLEETIYHLVQEALTNSFRHGKATLVKIMLWLTDSRLMVNIWDNGIGIGTLKEGIGLAGMRERLARMNGGLRLENLPDGFKLTAEIPLSAALQGHHGKG